MSCVPGESCVAHDLPVESSGSWGELASSPSISAYDGKWRLASGLEVSLPGHGDRGAGCGTPKAMLCDSCGRSFVSRHACMNRDCPDCFTKWARGEARIASFRLWSGVRLVARELARRYYRIVHVVVSFPDEAEAYRTCRERVYRVCREHGVVGGPCVFHPFRMDVDGEYVPDGYLHFHVIGVAFGNIEQGGLERDGDLVFKVVRDARHHDFGGFRSEAEVRACLSYELGHVGIVHEDRDREGVVQCRHALTWFGVLSYGKLSTETLRLSCPEGFDAVHAVVSARCPSCGSRDTVQIGEFMPDGLLAPDWALRDYQRSHACWGQWRVERGSDA